MAKRAKREAPPDAQLKSFLGAIEQSERLASAYLIRGEEAYFKRRALDAVKRRAGALDLEIDVHDAADPDFDAQSLLGDIATPPMFSSGQLVVARGVDSLLKSTGKKESPLVRAVRAFIERGEPDRSIVIVAGALRANHVLVKAFAEAELPALSLRRLYDSPPPWKPDPRAVELVLWVQSRAREFGLRLDADRALYVAAATGNDLEAIDGQLERMKAGAGEGELNDQVHWQAGGSPFAVADSLCRGDLRRSADGVEALFSGGMVGREGERVVDRGALTAILVGSLYRGVRQGLAAARARDGGADAAAAAEAAGVTNDRARQELLERLSRRPDAADWASMLEDLADLDRRSKSGAGVDASDFATLALRWAVRERAGAGRR
ncbi:MAG: DNA polymerase III subunit delta [Planctomycetota bacterium]|jgi:DNA polymerase III delta subunit